MNDTERNFIFRVGIDPTGGTNPFAGSVVWGKRAHIYNVYHEAPPVEAIAQSSTATVFLLSKTKWTYKHNDAYFDDATLEVVDAPEPPEPPASTRGAPREQYERIYAVLPADTPRDVYARIAGELWDEGHITSGGSYDDSGVGDLDVRKALLYHLPVSRQQEFFDWYAKHYPGVEVEFREPLDDVVVPPPNPSMEVLGPHIQNDLGAAQEYIRQHSPLVKLVNNFELAPQVVALGAEVLVRFHVGDYRPFINDPDRPGAASRFLNMFWDSLWTQRDYITYVQILNETCHDAATLSNSVAFEMAVSDELEQRDGGFRHVALTPSVGQPPQHDMELIKPLAEKLIARGGAMGYNSYYPRSLPKDLTDDMRQYKHPFDAWASYPGRFELMRFELDMPNLPFILPEAGVCGWKDNSGGGWQARVGWRDCYRDFAEYLPHLLDYRERVLSAGNVLGACLFTTYDGGDWPLFHYGVDEWAALSEVLEG